MTEDFCARTARRIRRLGYAKKKAAFLSKFCYVSMMSVCGMMGAMLDPQAKSMAGEEGKSPLRLQSMAPSVQGDPEYRRGMRVLGARAVRIPLFLTLHRRLPA